VSFEVFFQRDALQRKVDGELIIPYGVSFLDEALCGIIPGDIVLIGAKTGVGKTQFATQVALNAAQKYKRVHYFALEAEQNEIERRLLHSEMAKAYWLLPSHRRLVNVAGFRYVDWRVGKFSQDPLIQEIEKQAIVRVRQQTTNLSVHYRPNGMTVDEFLSCLEGIQLDCDLLILDHFHYFDWEENNENHAIKTAVKKIRTAALKHRVPILLVAHLRKSDGRLNKTIPEIDDFHGSSDLSKICTSAILIARANLETQSGNSATHFYIAKSRNSGDAAHYVGTVGYNLRTGTYEKPYCLGRSVAGEVKFTNIFPSWAINVQSAPGVP
jgi:replicative DNA helicase